MHGIGSLAPRPSPAPWRSPVRRRAAPRRVCRPLNSFAGHIAPQDLVELQLKTHGKAIGQNPIRQQGWRLLVVARGEKNAAACRQIMVMKKSLAPLIVLPRADHEF